MAANMLNDIVSAHKERILNLKKYYPFFKLTEISFSQFKDGKYAVLDMGYIVMGILRFFIEENNFKEKDVTYPEYLEFITTMIKRDFGLFLSDGENKEIADYIFDKIKNEGKPFDFEYFDPVDKKKKITRIRIIESSIKNNTVWYSISPDAIEFYLDTKEIKDESRINVSQLLLEKMIREKNFKGGIEVVERINEEVNRLQFKKNEIMRILSSDVFAGIEAYEEFVDTGMRWFEEEEKLFKKNQELIKTALSKVEKSGSTGEVYYRTISEIYDLENQLKVAMNRHGDLLKSCTDMQHFTDEAVKRAKLNRLRSHVDFERMLNDMIKTDNADILADIIRPLFKLKTKKTFNLNYIDEALTIKPAKYEVVEKVSAKEPEDIIFDDELEEKRISDNYSFIMSSLLQCFEQKKVFTLEEFNRAMSRAYSQDILKNADYFSFFVNLCQKTEYEIGFGKKDNESFLDEILNEKFKDSQPIKFKLKMRSDNMLKLYEGCEVSDIMFERVD